MLRHASERAQTDPCVLAIEDFHGDHACRADHHGLAAPRAGAHLLLISQSTDPAWARTTFEELAPYMAERAYTNYLQADDRERVGPVYGVSYDRLVELKRRDDPNNLFHLNQNLGPS